MVRNGNNYSWIKSIINLRSKYWQSSNYSQNIIFFSHNYFIFGINVNYPFLFDFWIVSGSITWFLLGFYFILADKFIEKAWKIQKFKPRYQSNIKVKVVFTLLKIIPQIKAGIIREK